jgi:methyltransferase (TIGR00027 family)
MRHERPSRTAYRVALRRAAHQLFDEPKILVDPLATRILEPQSVAALRNETGIFASTLRAFLVVRSRVAEDELAQSVARGVAQYVVLGAGLDTFAYRNPYPEGTLRVFEVDHPATQAWKRRRLAEGGIPTPPGLTFVPVDFERDDLASALRTAGLRADRPAFFSWLGVTLYLNTPSIVATLKLIAGAAGDGGGAVFDYGVHPSRLSWRQRAVYAVMAARVKSVGEPWISTFDPGPWRDDVQRLGFTEVDDLGPAELNARYCAARADGLRVGGLAHVMAARMRVTR